MKKRGIAGTKDDRPSELPHVPIELKDRALAAAAEGITISDLRLPDQPLIYANDGFERLTLYPAKDIIGKNCRFLQGPETDRSVVDEIRRAVEARQECTVELLNYRKDGTPFWNRLSVTPVRDRSGEVTHYIGVQSDTTKRREAELALLQSKQLLEAANNRMKQALEAAARIQQSLLPSDLPEFEDIQVGWAYEPCDELAGDSLNVFALDENHLAFHMLDVSGHGVQAALLSVSLSHWLSPKPGHSCLYSSVPGSPSELVVAPPHKVIESLNDRFPMDMVNIQFFTIVYAVLNRNTGDLTYAVAGSPSPLYSPQGQATRPLDGQGTPIGVVPGVLYEEHTVHLSPGDRFFLYTDGIIEAENDEGEQFSLERLASVVSGHSHRPLGDCVTSILANVRNWATDGLFRDDASILAIEYLGR